MSSSPSLVCWKSGSPSGPAVEEALQIAANLRVGVFLNQERGGSVLQVDCAQAGFHPGVRDEFLDRIGDLVEAASACGKDQFMDALTEHGASAAGGTSALERGRAVLDARFHLDCGCPAGDGLLVMKAREFAVIGSCVP
jgi:hypothetical protein